MENLKKMYEVIEGYDGGSEYKFETLEEAEEKAKRLTKELRFTKRELDRLKAECGNFIAVCAVYVDEDGDQIGDVEEISSYEFDESTLDRIY